ncbi:MAG: hypothetical protein K0B37_07210 [Bacteroidales bacterium]|nr:hypothetical protein [Bacteroidales bacterium]
MPQKKSNQKKSGIVHLSPENYIRQRARSLPVHECLINKGWKESGEASILISRKHVNGNYTYGIYLVDLYCLGIKESLYGFNISDNEYLKAVNVIKHSPDGMDRVDYPLVHNIIYGAEAYAEDLGFHAIKDFKRVTRYLLEEDTEETEWKEIQFGRNGKPCLVITDDSDHSKMIMQLERFAGPGNFDVLYMGAEFEAVDPEAGNDQLDGLFNEIEEYYSWDANDWEALKKGKKELPGIVMDHMIESFFQYSYSDEEIRKIEREVDQMFQCKITDNDYTELAYYQQYRQDDHLMELLNMAVGAYSASRSKYSFKMLKELIRENPDNPLLFSTLTSLYIMAGKKLKVHDITKYAYQRFPRYFFIFMNYLEYLIDTKQITEFEKVIDNRWLLSQFFPERDVFAKVEVFRFYNLLVVYFGMKGSLLMADRIIKKLRNFVPDNMKQNMDQLENFVRSLKNEYLLEIVMDKQKIKEIKRRISDASKK